MIRAPLILALFALLAPGALGAQEGDPFARDAYAPAESVVRPGDAPAGLPWIPILERGGVELSLSYVTRSFDGLRDGTSDIDPASVLGAPWSEVPVSGSIQRFELGLAWAASERVTFELVLPLEQRKRTVALLSGGESSTSTEGLGDIEIGLAWELVERGRSSFVVDLGVSTPTGSIDEQAVTPTSGGLSTELPYQLQLGSGSFELIPGLTWLTRRERYTLGASALARLPLGANDRGWKVGESYLASAFASFDFTPELAGSLRLAWAHQANYSGSDPDLDPTVDPGQDPSRLGRSVVELLLGFGWSPARGRFSNCRVSVEGGVPVWEDVDGPNVASEWTMAIGLSVGL